MHIIIRILFVMLSSYGGNALAGILRNTSTADRRIAGRWNETRVLDWRTWLVITAMAGIGPFSNLLVVEFVIAALLIVTQDQCPILFYPVPLILSVAIHYSAIAPWCIGGKDWLWLGCMPGIGVLLTLLMISLTNRSSLLYLVLWTTSIATIGVYLRFRSFK